MSDGFKGRTAMGYERCKNLMKQLDWKLMVTLDFDKPVEFWVYHPKQPRSYKVRRDSGRRLLDECRWVKAMDDGRLIYCYNHDGADESLI